MRQLDNRLAVIAAMNARTLRAEWQRVHGKLPPTALSSDLLARGLAQALQEKAHGVLPRRIASTIDARVRAQLSGRPAIAPIKSGTRFSRQWHGEVYHVIVTDNGFEYGGALYTSLSAIARRITGTAWSGPKFFGLGSPRLAGNQHG